MKLAVSSWSLHRPIEQGQLHYDGLPRVVRERFGVRFLELVNVHVPRPDAAHLDRLARALEEAGVGLVNIAVDWGNIAHPDPRRRRFDLQAIRLWIDAAAYLGCPCVRINSGSGPDVAVAIDSYRELVAYGRERGVGVLVENHGGFSSDPAQLGRILREVDGLGTCPDFGNFPDDAARRTGLAAMAPAARVAHVKAYDFAPDGSHPRFDLVECLEILAAAGFRGALSVEFEGSGDPWDGTRRVVELVRRWRPDVE